MSNTKRDLSQVVFRSREKKSEEVTAMIGSNITSHVGAGYKEQYHTSFKNFLQLLVIQSRGEKLQKDPGLSRLLKFIRKDKCWPKADDYVLLRNHIRAEHAFCSHAETIGIISCFENVWEKFVLMNH